MRKHGKRERKKKGKKEKNKDKINIIIIIINEKYVIIDLTRFVFLLHTFQIYNSFFLIV